MAEVVDLDILRPEKKIIRLNGKEFDVSFVPVAITFDIDDVVVKLSKIDDKKIGVDPDVTRTAFDLTVKLCSIFCEHYHPEMDEDWFLENVSPSQAKAFADAVKDALTVSYNAVERYRKN